eukprot:8181980-Ditylum_brightwellii.AAC.1
MDKDQCLKRIKVLPLSNEELQYPCPDMDVKLNWMTIECVNLQTHDLTNNPLQACSGDKNGQVHWVGSYMNKKGRQYIA